MKYVSVEEMIQIEKAADAAGHSYASMMEHAGRGVADTVQKVFGDLPNKKITALVGAGNNGGDALVALSYLLEWGWDASVLIVRDRKDDDPLLQRYQNAGGSLRYCLTLEGNRRVLDEEISSAFVLLDGVLGTGIRLPVRGDLAELLGYAKELISTPFEEPTAVVAVDCPSGIDCDSGEVDPVCIPADLTVTMAAVKQGLLKFPAFSFLGQLVGVGIGLPEGLSALEKVPRRVVDASWVEDVMPERPLNAHKGTFGTALIAAGSVNYPGAALLAASSAYRIGAGLVTLAVPQAIFPLLISGLPEATWVILEEQEGGIARKAVDTLKDSLSRADSFLVGPGFGLRPGTRDFLLSLFSLPDLPPLVVDADALRLLGKSGQWWETLPAESVLTPHPGEMAALTGKTVTEIQGNRVLCAEESASRWEATVVLKGAHTVIASPGKETGIIPAATPALSKAGTGDVLAGLITGLLAQGHTPHQAAAAGAWIHAQAGMKAADWQGSTAAVLAGDVSEAIGDVLAEIGI